MSWMQARQTKFWSYASVYVIVVLAILGAVNWLAQRHVKSWDSTSNKRFSLSDQTEKLVKGLKQDVKVVHFDQTSRFPQAKDLLDRYNNLSSKLQVEYVDPEKKPLIAKSYGLRTIPATFVEVGGKREEARSLTEEEVTSALIRGIKPGDRLICSVQGSGEHSFDDNDRSNGYSALKTLLERNNYKTRSIRLVEKPEIPKECTVTMVAGPRFDYLQPAVDALRAHFLAGGKIFFLLDPPIKMARSEVSENAALLKLLEDLGVTVRKDLVLDTSGVGQIFGLSEVVPLVTSYESHVTVRDMREVATAYPLARSLESKATSIAQVEKLFSTSANSYATENLTSAEIRINPDKDKKGPHVLGMAGTSTGGSGGPDAAKGRFVVVGSSGFMSNGLIAFNGNRDMAMNLVNWLSADEDLISIRPKDPQDRRLNLTRSQMRMVAYSSLLILPLMVLIAGVSVWWKRR